MASKPREYLIEGIYHLYNRGIHKERIFLYSEDYVFFIIRLQEYACKYDVTVLSYCLMPNHYHLLLRQNGTTPLSS